MFFYRGEKIMSDTKWESIAAHIETAQDSDYVNTVKAWLDQYHAVGTRKWWMFNEWSIERT